MPKPKVENRELVTSRDGVTVAFRLSPVEDRALKALIEREQAELESRGSPYRASAASVLRTLLRAKAVAVGVWDASVSPAAPISTLSPDEVREKVLAVLTRLHAEKDTREILTIPKLKAALPDIPGERINTALLELEATRTVDLKIANDPTKVEHPEQGFRVADRGLVYLIFLYDSRQQTIFEAANAEKSAPTPTPPATDSAAKPAQRATTTAPKATMVERLQMVKAQKLMPLAQIATKIGVDPTSPRNWIVGTRPIPDKYKEQLDAILTQLGV